MKQGHVRKRGKTCLPVVIGAMKTYQQLHAGTAAKPLRRHRIHETEFG